MNAQPHMHRGEPNGHDLDRARDALNAIPPDLPRDDWVRAGMAAQSIGLDVDDFNDWSAGGSSYNERDALSTWRSFTPGKGVGAGTLFKMAADHGWRPGQNGSQTRPIQPPQRPQEAPPSPRPGMGAIEVWERCKPAPETHPYIEAKRGNGTGLRVVPDGDPLTIAGLAVAGWLVVPVIPVDGSSDEPVSLQFFPPPGEGKKLNLPCAPVAGVFIVGEMAPGSTTYVCEGIGQAWACWMATGAAAVVCFGWSRVGGVARELRQRDASARLVLVPDVGKEQEAATIAAEVSAAVASMPSGEAQNFDANDYAQREGLDALERLLSSASEVPTEYPLSVAFADELQEAFTPLDELVEGVLTVGDGSVLYGNSNSGKTFLAIDMACAVARGASWMGRRTEPGLVIYLAAESPSSVRARLQAYQKHYGVRVPNFAIVQSPIDLFEDEADTDAIIALVRQIEAQRGQPARLIVGDTLARLSAGANENAGQDMGLVVRRFDRIRTECKAHFLLVHHSGKAAAAGARGWSGIRAAIDTEIEIIDSADGRCAEITKQRDLSTKGERIGFRLDSVTLGVTKWGAPATSCVVVSCGAPQRAQGKRMGEVEGAVVEFLAAHKVGIKKARVVEHFAGRYEKGPIYRAMKKLVIASAIHEAAGMVSIATAAK